MSFQTRSKKMLCQVAVIHLFFFDILVSTLSCLPLTAESCQKTDITLEKFEKIT